MNTMYIYREFALKLSKKTTIRRTEFVKKYRETACFSIIKIVQKLTTKMISIYIHIFSYIHTYIYLHIHTYIFHIYIYFHTPIRLIGMLLTYIST